MRSASGGGQECGNGIGKVKMERKGVRGNHGTLSGGVDGRTHHYPSRGNNGRGMGSGKSWIRGGEKESALAAPGLSGSEGG